MSPGRLLGGGPATPALASLIVDEQDFGWLPEDDFVGHFAARMGATTTGIDAGHLAMVTDPDTVVDLIEQAAKA